MTDSDLSRRIRSFVIRTGRMTDSQKAGWDIGFPKHGFTLSDNQFDWNSSFDVVGPRVLEIGFGMGDSLVAMAEQNPESRYLGIEVHTPGVGKLLADVERRGIRNLRSFLMMRCRCWRMSYRSTRLISCKSFFPILGIKNGIISGV